ncbi:hypothetical protein EON64_17600, partial [archaeon]
MCLPFMYVYVYSTHACPYYTSSHNRVHIDGACNGDIVFVGGRNNYCFNYQDFYVKYTFPKVRAYANADCTGEVMQEETVGKADKCHAFEGDDDWSDPIFSDDADDDDDDVDDDDDYFPVITYVQHTLTQTVSLIQPADPPEPFTMTGAVSLSGVSLADYNNDKENNDLILQQVIATSLTLADATAITIVEVTEVSAAVSVHGMRGTTGTASTTSPSNTGLSHRQHVQVASVAVQFSAAIDPADLGYTTEADAYDALSGFLEAEVASGDFTTSLQAAATLAGTALATATADEAVTSMSSGGDGDDAEAFPVGGIIGVVIGGVVMLGLIIGCGILISQRKNGSVG